jgi:hypothetical protein
MPENTDIDRMLSDGSYINYSDQGRRAVQVLNEEDPHHHITGYTDTTDGWHHTIHSDGLGAGRIGLNDPRL